MSEGKRKSSYVVQAPKREAIQGELRKAVDAIYTYPRQGKLTLVARRAFNLMLARAMEKGVEHEWYEIRISDLAKDMRFDSKDMRHLEDTLDAMQATLLKWDVLEEIAGKRVHVRDSVQLLGAVSLIGGVDADGRRTGIARTVRYQFDSRVKQRLLVPEVYARINLQLQSEFRSNYTLALYEQVIRYKGNHSSDGWSYTVKLPWREWRNLILGGDGASIYEEYKYFSRDVLIKALKELNDVVDEFDFEVMVYRTGRFISDLQFRIRTKAQQALGLQPSRPLIDTEEITARMKRIGLKEAEITKHLADNDIILLEEAAGATEARLRRNDLSKVMNPAAYFADSLKRLKDHLRTKTSAVETPGVTKAVKDDVVLLDAEAGRGRRRGTSSSSDGGGDGWSELENRFRALPSDRRDAMTKMFVESLDNPAVVNEITRKGVSGPLVRAVFVPWLRENIDKA